MFGNMGQSLYNAAAAVGNGAVSTAQVAYRLAAKGTNLNGALRVSGGRLCVPGSHNPTARNGIALATTDTNNLKKVTVEVPGTLYGTRELEVNTASLLKFLELGGAVKTLKAPKERGQAILDRVAQLEGATTLQVVRSALGTAAGATANGLKAAGRGMLNLPSNTLAAVKSLSWKQAAGIGTVATAAIGVGTAYALGAFKDIEKAVPAPPPPVMEETIPEEVVIETAKDYTPYIAVGIVALAVITGALSCLQAKFNEDILPPAPTPPQGETKAPDNTPTPPQRETAPGATMVRKRRNSAPSPLKTDENQSVELPRRPGSATFAAAEEAGPPND